MRSFKAKLDCDLLIIHGALWYSSGLRGSVLWLFNELIISCLIAQNLFARTRSPATPARFMEWFSCSCMIGF